MAINGDQMNAWVNAGGSGEAALANTAPTAAPGDDPAAVLAKYPEAVDALAANIDDVTEALDLVDSALLTDPDAEIDEEVAASWETAVEDFDPDFVDTITSSMGDASWEDCQLIAGHFASEGDIGETETEKFGGFVYRLAHGVEASTAAHSEPDGDEVDTGADDFEPTE